MTTIMIPVGLPLVPQPKQAARNGLYVNAFNSHRMIGLVNNVVRNRPKHVASFANLPLQSGFPLWTAPATTRDRWKFVYHSSPYCGQLRATVMQHRQQLDGGSIHAAAGSVVITVATMAGVTVATATIPGAPGSLSIDDNLMEMRNMRTVNVVFVDPATGLPVNLPVDTDLQVTITEKEFARCAAVGIFEDSLNADTANGYLDPNVAVMSPIYSTYRQGVTTLLRATWRRGASHLFNWSKLIDVFGAASSPSTASATAKNIWDGTSTAVTASSPGFYLALGTGLTRLSDSAAVRCKVWVWGKDTTNGNGLVSVKQQSGGTISVGPFTTSFSWVSATGALDPANSKADVMFSTNAGTLTVGAISMYIYET